MKRLRGIIRPGVEGVKSYGAVRRGDDKLRKTTRTFQKSEVTMNEKKHFYLQMFADEPESNSEEQTETKAENPNDPSEPKPKGKAGAKYTDADIDKIINQKFAEWQKKKDLEISEAQKLAEMNAQQKAEYERDQLQKKLDELMKKDALSEMTKTARKMLAEEEITIPDELLSRLVSTDAEATKTSVDAFAKLFKDSVQSAVKNILKGDPPKTGARKTNITKEEIMNVKNTTERQRLIEENMELFGR